MDHCCDDKADDLSLLKGKQRRVLIIVLVINLGMFFIEGIYGYLAHSVSLMADSLDMLGDAFVYGISLVVLNRSSAWRSGISLLKGIIMAIFGIGVLASAFNTFMESVVPHHETMTWIGALALLANLVSAALLLTHRNDDINMKSVWLCSRNDVIANIAVLFAAFAVMKFNSQVPDLIVGVFIAFLVLRSAVYVIRESGKSLWAS